MALYKSVYYYCDYYYYTKRSVDVWFVADASPSAFPALAAFLTDFQRPFSGPFCQGRRHGFKSGGTKRDSPAERAKTIVPPLFQMWERATGKLIIISIEYTEICCLVALVNVIGLYYSIMYQRRRQFLFHVSAVNKIY